MRCVTCRQPVVPVRDVQNDPATRFQMDDTEADLAAAAEDHHAAQIRLTNGNPNNVEIVSMATSIDNTKCRCSCKRNGQKSFIVEREFWSLCVVGVRQKACARFLDKPI